MYTENKRPLVIFAISFLVGIALALSLSLYNTSRFSAHAVVGLVASVVLFIFMRDKTRLSEFFLIGFMGICLSLITYNHYMETRYYPAINLVGSNETVVIRVDENLRQSKNKRYNYIVTIIGAENADKFKNVKVRVSTEQEWNVGDAVLCPLKLNMPRNSFYFSYENYLASIGVFLTGSIDEENALKIDYLSQRSIISIVREKTRNHIYKYIPDSQAALVLSLTTSETISVEPDLYSVFAESGLTHIISAASSIITFLSGAVVKLLRKIGVGFRLSYFLGILSIILIVIVVGFEPSAVRSGIVGIMYFLGKVIDRPSDTVTSLSFAALLSAIHNPFIVFSMSFVFTYTSFLCLITIVPNVLKKCREKFSSVYENKITSSVFEVFVASLIINLVLTPINIYYFRRLSICAPLSNVFVAPLIPVIIFLGTALIILGFIPFCGGLALLLGKLGELCVDLFVSIARMFASLPYSSIFIWGKYVVVCLAVILALIACMYVLKRKNVDMYAKINKFVYFLCAVIILFGYSLNLANIQTDVYLAAVNVSRSNSFALFGRMGSVVVLSKSSYNDANELLGYLENNGTETVSVLVILDEGKSTLSNAGVLIDAIDVENIIAPKDCIVGVETIPLQNGEINVGTGIYIEAVDDGLYVNMENVSVGLYGKNDIGYSVTYGMYIGESKRDFVPQADYVIGSHGYNRSVQEIVGDSFDGVFMMVSHEGKLLSPG